MQFFLICKIHTKQLIHYGYSIYEISHFYSVGLYSHVVISSEVERSLSKTTYKYCKYKRLPSMKTTIFMDGNPFFPHHIHKTGCFYGQNFLNHRIPFIVAV